MTEQTKIEEWLKTLAEEIFGALNDISKKGKGLNIEVLAQTLGDREIVHELVSQACRPEPPEVAEEKSSLDINELRSKYQEAREDLRHAESYAMDVEEALKNLALVLANLADTSSKPQLKKEIRVLKEDLRKKAAPSRIESISRKFKDFIMHDAGDPALVPVKMEAGPEGVEENVRDILINIVDKISLLEDEQIKKRGRLLIKKIRAEFTFEDYDPIIQDIYELILMVKELLRRSRQEIYKFTEEVISRLEDTEKDFLKTIGRESAYIGTAEEEFEKQIAGDIRGIEESFKVEGASLEDVRKMVFAKIALIRERFRKKRAQDQAHLARLASEKAGVEKRLKDIHRRYEEFTRQSHEMFSEMEKFRQASISDGLTGIFNRRAYDAQIKKAVEELKKGSLAGFSLIVFDIDHFKDFNNNYGHRAGDKILVHVARMSRDSLRQTDFIARYGGDEFAAILPEANLKTATKIAKHILSEISSVEFKIYRDHDLTVKVGLSMGVAESRKDDSPDSIFQRADKALYLAKDKGRNQVRTEKEVKNK